MNHTTNYQLSQWEAGDKVQRVDFNADNAKIDAALAAKAESTRVEEVAAANCLCRLIDYTVPANAASVTVSLPSGSTPEQYAALVVCTQTGTGDYNTYVGMQINDKGHDSTYEHIPYNNGNTQHAPTILLGEGGESFIFRFALLFGRLNNTQTYGQLTTEYFQYKLRTDIPYKDITNFSFYPIEGTGFKLTSGYIRAGSRIRVYGLK